jgi:hypothetical protein
MFIIQHNGTGKYVACPGSLRSYTNRLEEARVFRTRESAEKERCVENETLVDVNHLISRMTSRSYHE